MRYRTTITTRIRCVRPAIWVILVGLLTSGCYNPKEVEAFLLKPRQVVSGVEYRVYPPDVISISSLHVPEIDGATQQVRPDGKINLPLLGEVYAAGKTPKEIEKALTDAASDYYEQVDATVQVVGYNSQRFYVFGQVSQPGPMPWTGRDTLLDALAKAYPTRLAWPERIMVLRGSEPHEGGQATTQPSRSYALTGVHERSQDNSPKKLTVNLMAMVRSGDMTNNIFLMPNDVIYVQPNPFARAALAIETFFSPFRAAGDGLGDYREMVRQIRDTAVGRDTLIVR